MGKGRRGSLKAALSSQQTRLKKKQEAVDAVRNADRAKLSGSRSPFKGKAKATASPRKPLTIPFKPTDKILLIGEGNFSFARALACSPPLSLEFLPPSNITATAYDSLEECRSKYPDAPDILASLQEKGVELVFGVDASRLEKCAALKGRKFDRIVWNFPHAGKGIADQDRNILSNQVLLLGFLSSAASFLVSGPPPTINRTRKKRRDPDEGEESEDDVAEAEEHTPTTHRTRGTILITLRNVSPYTLWDLPKLAKHPPSTSTGRNSNPRYIQLRSFVFHRSLWRGYQHRMTKGERAHGLGKTVEGGEDRTWEFCLAD